MQVMQMMVVMTRVAWHNFHPLDFQGKEIAKGKHLAECRNKCMQVFTQVLAYVVGTSR